MPAASSTPRCCTTVGMAKSNGRATSLTDAGPRARRSTIARRLPSPSARNTWSRSARYLGTYLSIADARLRVNRRNARTILRMLPADTKLISVDDHVIEPPHVFHDHIAARYRDRAPRITAPGPGVEGWEWEGRFYPL